MQFNSMLARTYLSLRGFAKHLMSPFASMFAYLRGYTFPANYPWMWKMIICLNRYELGTTRLIKKKVRHGMVVMDIGASLGYFTRLSSDLVGDEGKVYSFEPDDGSFQYLQRNTKGRKNVKLIQMAVSDISGPVDFYHVPNRVGIDSLVQWNHALSERKIIRSIRLDDFCEQEGIERVDVIKMDVEGGEERIFKGMERCLSFKPFIIFEYTPGFSQSLINDLQRKHNLYDIDSHGNLTEATEFNTGGNLAISD